MDYLVTLTGTQPLLMHKDNLEWEERIKAWRENPENKKYSVKGDDRSPPWTWLASIYSDDKVLAIPGDNIMALLREGGALVPVPGGKNGKMFKAQTQSGLLLLDWFWPLLVDGRQVPAAQFFALEGNRHFDEHMSAARSNGFNLFLKRARIGTSKHVRVRPMFRNWSATGTVRVTDDQIDGKSLRSIFEMAGKFKGLGDWRPSSKTPGPYGTFTVVLEEVVP